MVYQQSFQLSKEMFWKNTDGVVHTPNTKSEVTTAPRFSVIVCVRWRNRNYTQQKAAIIVVPDYYKLAVGVPGPQAIGTKRCFIFFHFPSGTIPSNKGHYQFAHP